MSTKSLPPSSHSFLTLPHMRHLGRRVALAIAVVLLGLSAGVIAAPLSGAIFTTDNSGTNVNQNIYTFRADVYLNGGPQNTNSAGLPDGVYFFQVTDPSGNFLLSTDQAVCRQIQVTGGVVAGIGSSADYPNSCPHSVGLTNQANGSTAVQLQPFSFTPNAGGEYKVWLIAQTSATSIDPSDITGKTLVFDNSDTKTDNFKVKETADCPTGCELLLPRISGLKFYDANTNGVRDASEPGIPGWQIELFGASVSNTTTVATSLTGEYNFLNLQNGTYGVCERLPVNTTPVWVPTTATSRTGIVVPPDSTDNNFGNVCLGASGGLTLGFWSNKNGQNTLLATDPGWRTLLTGLNLRDSKGNAYDIASLPAAFTTVYGGFRTWILSATATNMAYMLSAQLATMELNVYTNKVTGDPLIYAGAAPSGCTVPGLQSNGFILTSNLMAAANNSPSASPAGSNYSLYVTGNTTASGVARSCQQFMKTALDDANNNRTFVQPANQCTVNYSGTEKSCAP